MSGLLETKLFEFYWLDQLLSPFSHSFLIEVFSCVFPWVCSRHTLNKSVFFLVAASFVVATIVLGSWSFHHMPY